jgi:hypothetical protein
MKFLKFYMKWEMGNIHRMFGRSQRVIGHRNGRISSFNYELIIGRQRAL